MPLLSHAAYVYARESYSYGDAEVRFDIVQTGTLPHTGTFQGVFPQMVPNSQIAGVNLRKFEAICESVFSDAATAEARGSITPAHHENIKSVTCAVVHWKMASQRGRGRVENVQRRWTQSNYGQLIRAYQRRSLADFCINGVRLPIASAMLRFTRGNEYGIMDRRVVKHTQQAGITTLNVRENGYINDNKENIEKYYSEYTSFLKIEASSLAAARVTFSDIDAAGNPMRASFRPCDVEMALFSI